MSPPPGASDKSPLLAALASLLIPGFGHLYCGAWGRGLAVMFVFFVGAILLSSASNGFALTAYSIFLLLSAYDARGAATRENLKGRADLAEGAMKAGLGLLRAEVDRYRGEHDRPPESLEALVAAKALPGIPPLWPRHIGVPHPRTAATTIVGEPLAADTGRWAYVVSSSSPGLSGAVFIDCTHTDTRGKAWTSY